MPQNCSSEILKAICLEKGLKNTHNKDIENAVLLLLGPFISKVQLLFMLSPTISPIGFQSNFDKKSFSSYYVHTINAVTLQSVQLTLPQTCQ